MPPNDPALTNGPAVKPITNFNWWVGVLATGFVVLACTGGLATWGAWALGRALGLF